MCHGKGEGTIRRRIGEGGRPYRKEQKRLSKESKRRKCNWHQGR